MTFLPIVERELRVASRRPGTYWVRTGVALAVIAIGGFMHLSWRRSAPPAELGSVMFAVLSGIAGLFCIGAGRGTSDCLSEEKRDGTLGLLFLTDLRGFDVVAGKLVAGSLNSFYGLIATLPMLAIPLLMGGVSAAQFWRIALVLLNTMFFSLAAGMIASALTKSARNAAGLCALIVLTFTALLPICGAILSSYYGWNQMNDWLNALLLPSPGFAFYLGFDSNYASHVEEFAASLVITHVLGWIFLIAACLIVPRSWQDKAATVTQLKTRDTWLRWSLGNSAQRMDYRRRLLDVNAFFWLASRSRIKPAVIWGVLGLMVCGWLWGWGKFGREWLDPAGFAVAAFLLNLFIKGSFAGEVCAQLSEDRRTGALELLLSTPLDVSEVLRGQFLALCRQFLGPLSVVLLIELVFFVVGWRDNWVSRDSGWWIFLCASGLVVLFTDLAALFYVGLWQSLTARNANRAGSAAMVRILALPWIVWGATCIVINAISAYGGNYFMKDWHYILVWLFLSLAASGIFGITAMVKLHTQFRQVAMARYTPPVSLWNRIFGGGKGS